MIADGAAPFLPRVVVDWDDPSRRWRRAAGALLFVDLSGFTAMSERLAVLGREGAERVTEIIDEAFAALLVDAYRLGAALLKFGGDALLLFFEGADATARAARSAWEMRATLQRIGRIPTPAGVVELGMSCGVHAGAVDFFLVGGSSRDFVVVGPAVTAVVDAEGSAGSGNIVVSAGAASEIADHLGAAVGPGRLLVSPPEAEGTDEPVVNTDREGLVALLPVAIRRHLAYEGRETAEHRWTAVAFLHFDGTDELVRADPDVAAGHLEQLIATVQSAADANEVCFLGTDVDHDGGKIILTAGSPQSHEDDIDRLLVTVRAVVEAETALEVRVGVHAGPLLAAEVGPFYRRFYTVMGDTVNTAARVMSAAGASEILVTEEAFARAGLPFETEPVPPFSVKGKAKPLRALRLGRQLVGDDDTATVGESAVVFVGRSDVMELVQERFSSARSGQGQVIELVGPAGVGKTEIVRELLRRTADEPLEVTVLRCHRSTTGMAYAPVQASVRAALGVPVNTDPEEVVSQLRAVLEGSGADRVEERLTNLGLALGLRHGGEETAAGAQRDFRRLLAETIRLLLRIRYPDGVVIVVENTHWIDEPSLAMIRDLAAEVEHEPWLILSTARDDDGDGTTLTSDPIRLDELSIEHAVELARAVTQNRLLPGEARKVIARTGGNPLFIREVAALVTVGGMDIDQVPESLSSIFAAKLDRLDPTTLSIVRSLSVLGLEFDGSEAAGLLDRPVTDIDALVGEVGDVLTLWEGRIRFNDLLVQESAYQGLSYRRRRQLHRSAGEQIEASSIDPQARAEELATHFAAAGDPSRTWRYGALAGSRAFQRHAYPEAIGFLRVGLAAARHADAQTGDVAAAWRDLGRAALLSGRIKDALDPYAKARALLSDDPSELAYLCVLEGEARRLSGQQTAAVRWQRRARRLLEGVPDSADRDRTFTRSILGEAVVRYDQGRYREAAGLFHQALAHAEPRDDVATVAHASLYLCQTLPHLGDHDVMELGRRALDGYTRLGAVAEIANARGALASVAEITGDWDLAIDHYAAAKSVFEEVGRNLNAAVVNNNMGDLQFARGRFEPALELFDSAAAVLGEVGHVYASAVAMSVASTRDVLGADATDDFTAARRRTEAAGLDALVIEGAVRWAVAAAIRGDHAEAARRLHEVEGPLSARPAAQVAQLRALLAVERGEPTGELVDEALARAAETGEALHLGLAHAAAAAASKPEDPPSSPSGRIGSHEAVDHLAVARTLLEPLGVVRGPGWPVANERGVAHLGAHALQ